MKHPKQKSFALAKILVVLLVVAALVGAVLGTYLLLDNNTQSGNTSNTEPMTIHSNQDVDQATRALDESSLENELDPAQLDEDLNDLL